MGKKLMRLIPLLKIWLGNGSSILSALFSYAIKVLILKTSILKLSHDVGTEEL